MAWFLHGYLGTTGVDLLVDTGAQVSMLSRDQFERLGEDRRPSLLPVQDPVKAANGEHITIYGHAVFPLTLGGVAYECDFLVADMGGLPGHGLLEQV